MNTIWLVQQLLHLVRYLKFELGNFSLVSLTFQYFWFRCLFNIIIFFNIYFRGCSIYPIIFIILFNISTGSALSMFMLSKVYRLSYKLFKSSINLLLSLFADIMSVHSLSNTVVEVSSWASYDKSLLGLESSATKCKLSCNLIWRGISILKADRWLLEVL